jgi:organic radical activating enzyme
MTTQPTAALAGIPNGVQGCGVWAGYRQAFVRFASEAETAQMYSAGALVKELNRLTAKLRFHSICVTGRDVLGQGEFLLAVLPKLEAGLPILLDTDGQRPDAVGGFRGIPNLAVVQVSMTLAEGDAALERAMQTLAAAAGYGLGRAFVIAPREDVSDAVILRAVEQVHATGAGTEVVLHPLVSGDGSGGLNRRWATLLEQASAVHDRVRLLLRVPPPAGLR